MILNLSFSLQQTYGFIECAEQDLRVFFHYSQYKGHASELDVGGMLKIVFFFTVLGIWISLGMYFIFI